MNANDTMSAVDLGRRKIVALAAGVPALALGGAVLWESARGRPALAAGTTPIRRNIGRLPADDGYVEAYRDAVRVLRQRSVRDPLDPTGWDGLALQHALYCSSVSANLQVHWGWDFLTWHRGNIWMLERIMRDAIREPSFALPYWDASRDRRIPAIYWGKENPLADVTRLQGPEDELPDDFLDVNGPLSLESFFAFGGYPYDNPSGDLIEGALEQGFHNNVHNWVGGNMGMFATAGFETLFSAHHNNIDRAWEAWRAVRGQGKDPAEDVWLSRRYQFVNERKKLEDVQVKDLLDTRRLGYVFDNFEFGERLKPDPVIDERYAVRLPVDGPRTQGGRQPRILQFSRASVPIHPYCCRVFLEVESGGNERAAQYVGTFTVLPVQRGGAGGLDKSVTMQLSLSDAVRERLEVALSVKVVLVGVPLNGRAIPDAAVFPTDARLVEALI